MATDPSREQISGGEPILAISELSVTLPRGADRPMAVDRVSLELRRGEILCLVGESGAGKSVLANAIMGATSHGLAIAGKSSIRLCGQELVGLPDRVMRRIRGNRIAMIFQEPTAALNPSMTAGQQIEEVFALHSNLGPAAGRQRALALLEATRLPDPRRISQSYPYQLSGGECQRVVIAMAIAMAPDILVADEPTSALDATAQAEILSLLRELRGSLRLGILFITHDFGVVAEIADRIAVMLAGRVVETGPAERIFADPQHIYTRTLLEAVPSLTPPKNDANDKPLESALLTVENLSKSFGSARVVDDVTLTLARGRTLAVVGESGAGKSTLAKTIVRLVEPSAGRVLLRAADLANLSRAELRAQRGAVQLIFQDPYGSLNPRRRIGEAIARAAQLAGIGRVASRQTALGLIALVGLPREAYDRRPSQFSGGQRQRVNIARALAIQPEALILDEALTGLDVVMQARILALLRDLQKKLGIAFMLITHDLRVAAQFSDQIAVMKGGKLLELGPTEQVLTNPKHPYTAELLAAAPGRRAQFGKPRTGEPAS